MEIKFDDQALRPLIETVVDQVLERVGKSDQRIGYSEHEAAKLLGMNSHQLRDRRLEGAIRGKKIGKTFYYSPEVLRKFIEGK